MYTDDPYKRSTALYKQQKNTDSPYTNFFSPVEKKMATTRRRIGYMIDLNFTSQTISKFSAMMDLVEWGSRSSPQQAAAAASSQSFLSNSGKCICPCTTDHTNSGILLCVGIYTGDVSSEEGGLFVVAERGCFSDLLQGLYSPCSCGLTFNPWRVDGEYKQVC